MKKLIGLLIALSFISPAIYADQFDKNTKDKTLVKAVVKKQVAEKNKLHKNVKKMTHAALNKDKSTHKEDKNSKSKKIAKAKKDSKHKALAADHSAKPIKKTNLPNIQNKEAPTTAMTPKQPEGWEATPRPTDNKGFLKNAWDNFMSFFR